MQQQVEELLKNTQQVITDATTLADLEQIRTQIFGKKGQLTELLKQLGGLPPEQRSQWGQVLNVAKQELIENLQQRTQALNQQQLAEKLAKEWLDISLPGRVAPSTGSLHPVNRIRDRVEELFTSLGFTVIEGPEIDDDYNNFAALNISEDHPARSLLDTFYLHNGLLLRTHTSNLQNRVLKTSTPPIRAIMPGRVYRCESDQTHTPMFHQVEGIVVDEHCSFGDLKRMLREFLSQLFECDLKARFRPSYFPFTEPSAEMDITCIICNSQGCRVCKNTGWLEVLGCGMIHPRVLEMGNIDPERYSGFAFGVGMDRLTMLRYGVDDLRKFFENDLRFLEQF